MRAALKHIDSQSFTMFNPIQLERFQSADNFSITSEVALRHPNVVWEAIGLVLFVKLVAGRLGKPDQMAESKFGPWISKDERWVDLV